MMTKDEMQEIMKAVFNECMKLREEGQKEYAHDDEDAFANFNDDAQALRIDRMKCLYVFMHKHIRGIVSYINGHRSQRENVRGRINDVIVYLCLLRGMIEEEERQVDHNQT